MTGLVLRAFAQQLLQIRALMSTDFVTTLQDIRNLPERPA
jgi:hypothetical protein